MPVSGSRVLASAAGVGQMKVVAMGPTVVRIVVSASGSWGSGPTLVVVMIVGAWGWCWDWWSCQVLFGEGLGHTLLNHCTHVRDWRADSGVCDNGG